MKFLEDIIDNAKEDKFYPIVFYGASTTSAEYSMPNWGEIIRYWLKEKVSDAVGNYKKAYWNIQTSNRGINGGCSQDLLERLDILVLSLAPKVIFLSVGKNDAYYRIDTKITAANTRKIIQKSLGSGSKVVFMTTVPTLWDKLNEKIKDYVEVDRMVAQEFSDNENFIFIDFYNFFTKEDLEKSYTLVSVDGNEIVGIAPGEIDPIHYNKIGNALVVKIILKEVYGLDFDAEKFISDLADPAKKYPGY
ncbi:MAG: SGNH/GDSL hydrolase family protein [Parcubacteria group bacterium]|jgi:lysophospholipase L1-like esterase